MFAAGRAKPAHLARTVALRITHRALDAGIDFVETADVYSAGVSEEIVAKALKGRCGDVWLGADHIDLYQVRLADPDTDVAENLGALSALEHQGKGRYIDSSSYSGAQIVEAQWFSRERHLERFVTGLPPYSILVRGIEEDVLPTVRRHGMGTLTYSPISGGWLSGRYRKNATEGAASAARPQARFDMSSPASQRTRRHLVHHRTAHRGTSGGCGPASGDDASRIGGSRPVDSQPGFTATVRRRGRHGRWSSKVSDVARMLALHPFLVSFHSTQRFA
ncbi:aldo/keto reductase [Streptomyces griseicoloratus]|uniref:aldo/keto reductase n=1 Tax=Streptomyces griseicoloratus TaxID=2752516 RepID=UPI002810CCFE|nr:aldo/keto reductase [Streptomyces griseicoloratus]